MNASEGVAGSAVTLPESVTRVTGIPGPGVNLWSITKRAHEKAKMERCVYPDARGTHLRYWPLSELTIDVIKERWGAGEYRVCWFVSDPDNEDSSKRFVSAGSGFVFEIEDEPEVRAPASPPAPPAVAAPALDPMAALPGGFGAFFQLQSVFDQRAHAQLERTMNVAAQMSRGGGGIDGTTLVALMTQMQTQMQASTQQMIDASNARHAEAMAAVNQQLAALRETFEGADDEDDADAAPSPMANAAAAVARPFIRRNQDLRTAVVNYATENPGELFAVLRGIPEVFSQLSALVKQAAPPAPAPAAPPPAVLPEPSARPRARVVTAPTPPPPTGLNAMFHKPAEPAPVVPAPATAPVVETPAEAAAE